MKPSRPDRLLTYLTLSLVAWLGASAWQAQAAPSSATASQWLSLEDYLGQVRQGNTGVRGALEASSGASQRASEGELLTSPTAFSTLQYTHDGKPPAIPLYNYDFQNSTALTLGVSDQTRYGLTARLSHTLLSVNLENPSSPLLAALSPQIAGAFGSGSGENAIGGYNTATTFELSQALWGNGFGRATQARQEAIEASALASSYANRFAARTTLAEAESAYWRLSTARQAVALTQENYDRAVKTYEWSARRARLELADESDQLQALAQVKARKLELQRARDEAEAAARAFNTARGIDSPAVSEQLTLITPEMVLQLKPPKRAEFRDDVKAAREQSRAAIATSREAVERDKPTLDVFGSLALNGKDTSFGTAFSQSFSFTHPTAAVGLRFQAPLDFGTLADARAGYRREQEGTELAYQRKVFEQDRGFLDLTARLTDARQRLELASELEKAQEAKLFHERRRLQSGRSTAFQVLSFESDFALAQLNRIQAQSEVLGILTQLKLFGEES